jgi:hypothetical protein
MANVLFLKWGTVEGWDLETDDAKKAVQKWADGGVSMSAALQEDTPDQKQALIDAIDYMDEIWNDWEGVQMSKSEAKEYVRNYGV